MGSKKKTETKAAMRAARGASHAAAGLGKAKLKANDLQERLSPAVEDARERIVPMVEDARGKMAELAGTVATKLDESLPDKATPKVVKKASRKSNGRLRKVLMFGGLSALVAVVVKKVTGDKSQPQWQSTAPGRPMPSASTTTTSTTATPSATAEPVSSVSGLVAAEDSAPDPLAADVAGGGTPDEAAADSTDQPHTPTTPGAPAERVDFDKKG